MISQLAISPELAVILPVNSPLPVTVTLPELSQDTLPLAKNPSPEPLKPIPALAYNPSPNHIFSSNEFK